MFRRISRRKKRTKRKTAVASFRPYVERASKKSNEREEKEEKENPQDEDDDDGGAGALAEAGGRRLGWVASFKGPGGGTMRHDQSMPMARTAAPVSPPRCSLFERAERPMFHALNGFDEDRDRLEMFAVMGKPSACR